MCSPPGAHTARARAGPPSVSVGGDKLLRVPGLLGRREPSQPNTCPDSAPGAAGPGVPPLPLSGAVSPLTPRRTASAENPVCCAQESRDTRWDGPGSGCAKGGDLVAPAAASWGPRGPGGQHSPPWCRGRMPLCICPHLRPGRREEVWKPCAHWVLAGRVNVPRCPEWPRARWWCSVARRKRHCFSKR